MKTETLLRNARARIANEENWVRGHMYAFKNKPDHTDFRATLSKAKCFCSMGAVAAELGVPEANKQVGLSGILLQDWLKETKEKDMLRALKYLKAAASTITGVPTDVWLFNDVSTHSHADILAMFDLAIKRARRRHPNGG